MKLKFWKKESKNYEPKNVRLIVTGCCKESEQKALAESISQKGVKTVVTSVPVLGTFDL